MARPEAVSVKTRSGVMPAAAMASLHSRDDVVCFQ